MHNNRYTDALALSIEFLVARDIRSTLQILIYFVLVFLIYVRLFGFRLSGNFQVNVQFRVRVVTTVWLKSEKTQQPCTIRNGKITKSTNLRTRYSTHIHYSHIYCFRLYFKFSFLVSLRDDVFSWPVFSTGISQARHTHTNTSIGIKRKYSQHQNKTKTESRKKPLTNL